MKVDMKKAEELTLNLLDNFTQENVVEFFNVINVFEDLEESFGAAALVGFLLKKVNSNEKALILDSRGWQTFARKMKAFEKALNGTYFQNSQLIETRNNVEKKLEKN